MRRWRAWRETNITNKKNSSSSDVQRPAGSSVGQKAGNYFRRKVLKLEEDFLGRHLGEEEILLIMFR